MEGRTINKEKIIHCLQELQSNPFNRYCQVTIIYFQSNEVNQTCLIIDLNFNANHLASGIMHCLETLNHDAEKMIHICFSIIDRI